MKINYKIENNGEYITINIDGGRNIDMGYHPEADRSEREVIEALKEWRTEREDCGNDPFCEDEGEFTFNH